MTGRKCLNAEIMNECLREENVLMAFIVFCLMFLPMKIASSIDTLIYGLVIVFESLYLIVSSRRAKGARGNDSLLLASALLFIYMVLHFAADGYKGGERIVQTALFLLTLLSFSRFNWNIRNVNVLFYIFSALIICCLAYWMFNGRPTNYFSAFYGHSNGFAVILIAAISIALIDARNGIKIRHLIVVLICLALLLFANSRSAIFALAVFAICAVWLSKFKGAHKSIAVRVLFIVVVAGALLFSVIYPSLYGTELGSQLEHFSRAYLNKNFFSGRQIVWKMVLNALKGNEVFGLGLNMLPSMIYKTQFSSHNLYLQTVLQMGLVGLVLLGSILWALLGKFCLYDGAPQRIGIALLVAMLVHECFEVSLTQNNLAFGLFIWAIFGICISLGNSQELGL